MNINYTDVLWSDSILKKIQIVYDKIEITIFNDMLKKEICIECLQCVGMTDIIIWDEVIIENILLEKVYNFQSPLIARVMEMYGDKPFSSVKQITGEFYELQVSLINGLFFNVICKNVNFKCDD